MNNENQVEDIRKSSRSCKFLMNNENQVEDISS